MSDWDKVNDSVYITVIKSFFHHKCEVRDGMKIFSMSKLWMEVIHFTKPICVLSNWKCNRMGKP